jgi:penicillin-binding protein 2
MNNLSQRSYVVIAVFMVVGLLYMGKLFKLQLLDSEYKKYAENNVLREITQYPARGLIYDRNGKLLVSNKTAYDLLVTPREVEPFDTSLLCSLLDISVDELQNGLKSAKKYSRYKPSVLVKQISPESYAVLQEQLYKFKGFHSQTRTLREYSYPVAAHVLGYVGEVSGRDIQKDDYYSSGDYIGQSGVEKTYEKQLRGKKGVKKYMVDVHNRIQGSYLNGKEDKPAEIGKSLMSTLDVDLQVYAEKLMQNKKGAIVAIEPTTGEVLALVSAPTYDPGMLVGRIRGENYTMLSTDSLKPMFDRALQAKYPPGSTFKIVNALIGLQEKAITKYTRFECDGPESRPLRCTHYHGSHPDVVDAIRESCNPFLWNTFRSTIRKYPTAEEGFNVWRSYVAKFGVGQKISNDFAHALTGFLPEHTYYDKIYGRHHWNERTVISLSIGQGELGVTPLQMSNIASIIANRGYYFEPHIVKEVENDTISSSINVKHDVGIEKQYFDLIIEGMNEVSEKDYKRMIPGYNSCGKTGTIQNPHGSDHSAYTAFSPRENPKISIFVYVENGVWGSRYAAPIATLIMEKYLNDTISTNHLAVEKQMIDANLLNPIQPK